MDGIQPYGASAHRPASLPVYGAPQGVLHAQAHTLPHAAAPSKGPADYLRALRKRFWMVLALAIPVIMAGTWYSLRLPPVYLAEASVKIERPHNDIGASALLAHDVARQDTIADQQFAPNQLDVLHGRALAERVMRRPEVVQLGTDTTEMVNDLLKNLRHKGRTGTSHYVVSLTGTDPARTANLLRYLLEEFREDSKEETSRSLNRSNDFASKQLSVLEQKLKDVDARIIQALTNNASTIGPEGKSLPQDEYEYLQKVVSHLQLQADDLTHQMMLGKLYPGMKEGGASGTASGELAALLNHKRQLTMRLKKDKKVTRNFNSDRGIRHVADELQEVMDQIDELTQSRQGAAEMGGDPAEYLVEQTNVQIEAAREKSRAALAKLQESMPEHHEFQNMMQERRHLYEQKAIVEGKKQSFEAITLTQGEPVTILGGVIEPTLPTGPNRPIYIAACVILGLGMGIGLVCGMEHLDRSVKIPEHLTGGLGLPLFGVIPRIRRTSRVHRGGHLWTPGAPSSLEADAYRNLRASLLGLTGPDGPMVTLLVTSAKAGEGKSTTALNLAATCARAGERTLLVDVDFRRPSLASAFPDDGHNIGLVDVLAEDIPWSRAVVRTEIPNLDFIPAGDTTKIPVEILGTLEMRQLLKSLAQHHYDRVILDGPAVLGLADCRMLGRMVDGALMVVRAGGLELRPLQRAKAMLEQSRVPIAGVVFNALSDDWDNWSSYGREGSFTAGLEVSHEGRDEARAALTSGAGSFGS